ncbi:MAG: methyltransferase domain-containing protein [Euryarchaeota archaeon]
MPRHPTVYSGKMPTPGIKRLFNKLPIHSKYTEYNVLDFGAGTGRNSKYIESKIENYIDNVNIVAYDPNLVEPGEALYEITDTLSEELVNTRWDLITVNYVLNVVNEFERQEIMRTIDKMDWDHLFIELRPAKELAEKKWKRGYTTDLFTSYTTGSGTHQVAFYLDTDSDVEKFLKHYNLDYNHFKLHKSPTLAIHLRKWSDEL